MQAYDWTCPVKGAAKELKDVMGFAHLQRYLSCRCLMVRLRYLRVV